MQYNETDEGSICARDVGDLEVVIASLEDVTRNVQEALYKATTAGDKLFGSRPQTESDASKEPSPDGQINMLKLCIQRMSETIASLHHSLDRFNGL